MNSNTQEDGLVRIATHRTLFSQFVTRSPLPAFNIRPWALVMHSQDGHFEAGVFIYLCFPLQDRPILAMIGPERLGNGPTERYLHLEHPLIPNTVFLFSHSCPELVNYYTLVSLEYTRGF